MQFYAIRDWDRLYENSRSRNVSKLGWVPIPNRHDGETFTRIMEHEHGAEIFASFILLVQIASKSKSRGVLIRGNGQPHTITSLSAKCRAPVTWLSRALDYLTKETDWLELVDLTDGCQDGDRRVVGGCQDPVIEGKEGNGMKEGNGTVIELVKSRLNTHFNQPIRHWTEPELRELVEVSKRVDIESELKRVFAYYEKLKPDEKKFFPQSVLKILEGWSSLVDRAAKTPEGKKPLLGVGGIPIGVQCGL